MVTYPLNEDREKNPESELSSQSGELPFSGPPCITECLKNGFSAARASAYQFGNFGTAAKQLHSFKLTQ